MGSNTHISGQNAYTIFIFYFLFEKKNQWGGLITFFFF
jgi:hypothetical protein